MIPNYQDRQIESSGVSDMASFGISQDDSAHIMNILRDTLYSDKVLAVLREYSANAWDAHNMVGKSRVPIKVTLPTHMEPTLLIKDYGPGLSHTDVFQVYTQYGASTKRTSNVAVGQLGIGSKSGFAYSDSFTIISCNGGTQRTYVAILDASEKGVINLLDEQECGDETGITIQIPIKPEDIPEFVTKAEALFKFFSPRPDINIRLPPEIPVQARLKTGLIYDTNSHGEGEWLAVMGCIPYRLNLDQIHVTNDSDDKTGVGYWVHKLSGVLYFDIGEVHISASREELKYSKSTKQTIVKRFTELVDEFVTNTMAVISTNALSSWDKRLRSQILTKFDLPVPDGGKDLTQSYVDIQDEDTKDFASTFKILSRDDGHALQRVYVHSNTRIILGDDSRKLSGFRLGHHDLMLFKNDPDCDWDVILLDIDDYFKKHKIDGISIVKLSDQPWNAPFVKQKIKKIVNPKYLRRSFVLFPSEDNYHSPYSQYWEPTDAARVATDADVFVLIEGFSTEGHPAEFDLFRMYSNDKNMLESFGLTMPPIYGYKTSDKKPLKKEDCAGMHYLDWRKKTINELATGKAKSYLDLRDWEQRYHIYWGYGNNKLDMRMLGERLGRNHLIYDFLKKVIKAQKQWDKCGEDKRSAVCNLGRHYFEQDPSATKSESKVILDFIYAKYPLLSVNNTDISHVWGKNKTQWVEYVQMVDHVIATGTLTFTPVANKSDEEEDDDD
jgi:hypothetical protein